MEWTNQKNSILGYLKQLIPAYDDGIASIQCDDKLPDGMVYCFNGHCRRKAQKYIYTDHTHTHT